MSSSSKAGEIRRFNDSKQKLQTETAGANHMYEEERKAFMMNEDIKGDSKSVSVS